MTDKELDLIMLRLQSARDRKKEIALTKANAEIDTIRREAEAYWDGVYDAIKEVKNAMPQQPAEVDHVKA